MIVVEFADACGCVCVCGRVGSVSCGSGGLAEFKYELSVLFLMMIVL